MEAFDPQLKLCAEELKSILKKYDVSGAISLVSKTHGEFVLQFPTWSGVQPDGRTVRIKFTKDEKEKAAATAHLIVSHIQVCEMFVNSFRAMFDALRQKALISFSPLEGRITPHREDMIPEDN